eukprot:TRINITY_DN7389_c0_g1_i1.p1 TRINITY_DN7389_c0_g1~~TRINITY_DN7389_c0_g1_i1.p1  ORF type:complete len:673 (+),score=143.72 TRINITY_DN7389_c0_g1_i1:132-2150(+)
MAAPLEWYQRHVQLSHVAASAWLLVFVIATCALHYFLSQLLGGGSRFSVLGLALFGLTALANMAAKSYFLDVHGYTSKSRWQQYIATLVKTSSLIQLLAAVIFSVSYSYLHSFTSADNAVACIAVVSVCVVELAGHSNVPQIGLTPMKARMKLAHATNIAIQRIIHLGPILFPLSVAIMVALASTNLVPVQWSILALPLYAVPAAVQVTLYTIATVMGEFARMQIPSRALNIAQQSDLSTALSPSADSCQSLVVLKGIRAHLLYHQDAMTTLTSWFELRNGKPVLWNSIVDMCCQHLLKHAEQIDATVGPKVSLPSSTDVTVPKLQGVKGWQDDYVTPRNDSQASMQSLHYQQPGLTTRLVDKARALQLALRFEAAWLRPNLSFQHALSMLQGQDDGSFVVHSLQGEQLSLTVVHDAPNTAKPVHSATHWTGIIVHQQHSFVLREDAQQRRFGSLQDMMQYFSKEPYMVTELGEKKTLMDYTKSSTLQRLPNTLAKQWTTAIANRLKRLSVVQYFLEPSPSMLLASKFQRTPVAMLALQVLVTAIHRAAPVADWRPWAVGALPELLQAMAYVYQALALAEKQPWAQRQAVRRPFHSNARSLGNARLRNPEVLVKNEIDRCHHAMDAALFTLHQDMHKEMTAVLTNSIHHQWAGALNKHLERVAAELAIADRY